MTKAETNRKKLCAMLASGKTLVVPGAYDPMSAKLVERASFPAVYIGSYATAAAGFGMPDVGLVTMDEMAAHAKRIADAVDLPVIADGENGWNNAANILRTVRSFEQAGVCGIHIEDHEFGKHADVPQVLLSCDQMVQKIRAALDARAHSDFLIIARTDAAWAFDDVEDAIKRMNACTDAGADLVMPVGHRAQEAGRLALAHQGQDHDHRYAGPIGGRRRSRRRRCRSLLRLFAVRGLSRRENRAQRIHAHAQCR